MRPEIGRFVFFDCENRWLVQNFLDEKIIVIINHDICVMPPNPLWKTVLATFCCVEVESWEALHSCTQQLV